MELMLGQKTTAVPKLSYLQVLRLKNITFPNHGHGYDFFCFNLMNY